MLSIGARRVVWRYPEGADYVVLADPDGNGFCVIGKEFWTAPSAPPCQAALAISRIRVRSSRKAA